ncbi:hypothetical protein [Methylobacterium thuringiense]|uniref:Uncharacterized protein n=1 Tax=Methylobacterium thuringiense TaxID=1003091 RepID=A0ABQ4TGK5_9HYPH|nr:hypothetical protein [Methylobacterium thuringiense]GJE54539.1 hypothetical protein EKPJFOCH_1017 [Methylobacterium thuringiense]
MPWSLTPSHHGIEFILDDDDQIVGQVEIDARGIAWHVSACPVRFPKGAVLPARFFGCPEAWIPKRGDLLRFLGVPLPGFAACDAEPERRAA